MLRGPVPWTIFDTDLGPCAVAWTDAGVTTLQLPEHSSAATRERLLEKAPDSGQRLTKDAPPGWVTDAIARVRAHLSGKPQDLSRVPIDLGNVTPFAAKVYRALRAVPAGRTTSYGDLALMAGSPGASRAVGRAMAMNPFPLLVPCQRVVAAAGKPGGFSAYGGLVTKERILALEGASLASGNDAQAPLFGAVPKPRLAYDAKKAVRHLREADAKLARHIEKTGDFRLQLKESEGTFASLAEAIVYQQLHGKAAATIFGRVRALYPGGRLDPQRVLATKDEPLRTAGLSRNKLASLRDLAERANKGEIPTLPELDKMTDEAIVERLTKVRGIGRWTVEMLLIFRLGRPDVLPVADYGVRTGFARLFLPKSTEELPAANVLEARGERWRPFRSVASWYLWRASELD